MNTSTVTNVREAAETEEQTYSRFDIPVVREGGVLVGYVESGNWVTPLENSVQPERQQNYSVETELTVKEDGSVHVHYEWVPRNEDGIATYSPQDVRWDGYAADITAEETWAADIENDGYCAQRTVPELHSEAVQHMYEIVAEQLNVPNDDELRAVITTSYSIAKWDISLSLYEADYAVWEEQYEEDED